MNSDALSEIGSNLTANDVVMAPSSPSSAENHDANTTALSSTTINSIKSIKSFNNSTPAVPDTDAVGEVRLSAEEAAALNHEQLLSVWRDQCNYIDHLERQLHLQQQLTTSATSASASDASLITRRESDEKLKQQLLESTRRENILVMRLTQKDQEIQLLIVSNLVA